MTSADTLFDDAKARADILTLANLPKLYRAGRTWRGECPINGCSKGKKADGAFWISPGSQRFGCFACECQNDLGGDVIALEHALNSRTGETIRHAAARLAGVDLAQWDAERKARDDAFRPVQGVTGAGLARAKGKPSAPAADRQRERAERRAEHQARDSDREAWIAAMAAATWGEARSADGTPVELYLRARGVHGRPLELALQQVRFHPAIYHSGGGDREVRLPGMVGLIVAPLGLMARPTGGIHVTYLAEGGDLVWRRAPVDRSKTIWGPPQLRLEAGDDRPDRWGGVWLTAPDAEGPLLVGEGIESVLSAAVLAGEPVRAVAALSLGALQGGWLADRFGRVDVDIPRADPEAAAFFWPEPERRPWGEVRICVDRDMKPITRRCRKAGGGTWKRPLDSEDRARVCASLAEQHWRRAGANAVRSWAPAPGRDFNDELRARTPAGAIGRAA